MSPTLPKVPPGMSCFGAAAERSGTGNGRASAVAIEVRYGKGGSCADPTAVCVPKRRGKGGACVDDGPAHDSTAR